jgi:hypothetical protein
MIGIIQHKLAPFFLGALHISGKIKDFYKKFNKTWRKLGVT